MYELADVLLTITLIVLAIWGCAFVLTLLGLGGSAAARRRALQSSTAPREVRVVDITAVAPKMPVEVAECASGLEVHGFRRLGVMSAEVEGVPPLPIWLMLDGAGIQAQLVDRARRPRGVPTSVLWFISSFADGAALETAYLKGVELDDPDLRLQVAPSSVKNALDAHRRSMELFVREHGDPVPITTMAEYLRWEQNHRARFGEREARALVGYLFDDSVDSFRDSLKKLAQAFTMLVVTVVVLILVREIRT